jgi:paraquat-inducible protein A
MTRPDHGSTRTRALLPSTTAGLLICEHCDTVYRRRALGPGQVACCERCNFVLERHHRLGPNGLLAMTATAMVVFIQANIWPIVTLELNGRASSTTLWGTIITMWRQHAEVVAVIAAMTLFFVPLIKLLLFGWVFWFACRGERGPGFRPAMIALHYLRPWTMSEVFVLGAMVAIVKARVFFDVVPDPGIFAYGALMLLITVFGTIDLRQLWDVTRERAR